MTTPAKSLIVSSDPVLLSFLHRNLNTNGYQMASTSYTNEALKTVLEKESPDIIILDIMMPALDGIEVCLRIRQWSDSPILMLTTWGAGGDRVRGLDLLADSYLTEPFGIDGVVAWIEEALRRSFNGIDFLANLRTSVS